MSQSINLPISGKLTIKQFNADGVLVDERNVNNLVVDAGKQWIRDRMLGLGTISGATGIMNWMGIGYGTTAAAAGDTNLGNSLIRVGATGTSTGVNNNQIQYQATFGATGAGFGGATGITEAGIFNASSSGTMLARTVFSVINKGLGDTLSITWTITIG